jgi:hypothetical protein
MTIELAFLLAFKNSIDKEIDNSLYSYYYKNKTCRQTT